MAQEKTTFERELLRKGSIIYTNVGDSMMPLLRQHKDILIITRPKNWNAIPKNCKTIKLKKYDIPLYKRDNGTYVLHRVLKVRKEDYVICGDNRYKKEFGIYDKHIIGVLAGVIKNGKEISVKNKQYLMYTHLWCDFFYIRATILWIKSLPKRVKIRIKLLKEIQ